MGANICIRPGNKDLPLSDPPEDLSDDLMLPRYKLRQGVKNGALQEIFLLLVDYLESEPNAYLEYVF